MSISGFVGPKFDKTSGGVFAAPPDMVGEIVTPDAMAPMDDRLWAPLGNEVYSRPLCLNVTEGYYVHMLWVKRPGLINRHRHTGQVHVLTLKGHWHYPEKDWAAGPGTYVFEPPGETHTLIVPEGGADMMFMAQVRGALQYVDETGRVIGFDDVFTRLDTARLHYESVGLDPDILHRIIR